MMMTQITNWQPKVEAMSKAGNFMAAFGRGNLAALTQSTQAYMAGLQELSRLQVAMVQGLTHQAVENATALASAKTPQDVLAVQTNLARASIQRFLSEGTKLQQAAQTMVEQISAPLTQRVVAAAAQTKLVQAA
jgi:phasin family protein